MNDYDSTEETKEHIFTVSAFVLEIATRLANRTLVHDKSKFESLEKDIDGMSLLDLVEILAECKADGDMVKSLEINRERFGISDQLARILENTVKEMGWR